MTWKEVSNTSFQGGCGRDKKAIPENRQEEFRRMMESEIMKGNDTNGWDELK